MVGKNEMRPVETRQAYMFFVSILLQDIIANKSIRDALVYEEGFFRSKPVSGHWFVCFATTRSVYWC